MNLEDNYDKLGDREFRMHEEEGEEWKTRPLKDAARPLMKLASQMLKTVMAIVETIPIEGEETDKDNPLSHYRQWMIENAMKIPVKISGAMATGDYILMSENAVIIKLAARELLTHTSGLEMFDYPHQDYLDTLRSEIEEFKKLFVQWVRAFPKGDTIWPDGWGLFYSAEDVTKWNSLNPGDQVIE